MASLSARLSGARRITAKRRRVRVIAPEVEFGSALTANTLLTLQRRCPRHSFIWLMGADNMAFFGSWQRHHVIARRMPIAVIDRPGYSYPAMSMGVRLLDRRVPRSAGWRPNSGVPEAGTALVLHRWAPAPCVGNSPSADRPAGRKCGERRLAECNRSGSRPDPRIGHLFLDRR